MPAIPSSSRIWHRGHPSRLPSGSLHSAWIDPGRDAKPTTGIEPIFGQLSLKLFDRRLRTSNNKYCSAWITEKDYG